MANHRGLRIPAALCQVNADYIISFDMGYGENFLEPYMTPKQKECFVDIGTSAGGGGRSLLHANVLRFMLLNPIQKPTIY